MRCDDTEKDRVFFRSDSRLFRLNGEWFFSSREGDVGPFRNEREAHVELSRHVEASKLSGTISPKLPPKEKFEVVVASRSDSLKKPRGAELRLAGFDKTSLAVFRERARTRA